MFICIYYMKLFTGIVIWSLLRDDQSLLLQRTFHPTSLKFSV